MSKVCKYSSTIDTIARETLSNKADLVDGVIPSSQLPSYVDDVLEYASMSEFPTTGESGKVYVDTSSNITYRWSGSTYVIIATDLALGETASTAYAGNKGKDLADKMGTTDISSVGATVTEAINTLNINLDTITEIDECYITDEHSLWQAIVDSIDPNKPWFHMWLKCTDTSNIFGSTGNFLLNCLWFQGNFCGSIISHWNIGNSYLITGNTYETDAIEISKITSSHSGPNIQIVSIGTFTDVDQTIEFNNILDYREIVIRVNVTGAYIYNTITPLALMRNSCFEVSFYESDSVHLILLFDIGNYNSLTLRTRNSVGWNVGDVEILGIY